MSMLNCISWTIIIQIRGIDRISCHVSVFVHVSVYVFVYVSCHVSVYVSDLLVLCLREIR